MSSKLPTTFGPLVSAGWLAGALDAADLRVIDATLFLPNEGRDAAQEFQFAHISGAQRFDVDLFSDPDSTLPHMAPTAERFAVLAGALGLGSDTKIVCYDQRGLFSAARAWWLLRYFGHERTAVLDGGLPAWLAAGYPVARGEADVPVPARFGAVAHPAVIRSLDDIRRNLATAAEHVVDARSAPRFTAEAPEPRPNMRGGHIPGSTNLPFGDLLNVDGTLLEPDALRARLARAGIDGTRPVVTTCGSGVTACVVTLAMAVAGFPEGAVYDGAWSEWGGRPDTPVEV